MNTNLATKKNIKSSEAAKASAGSGGRELDVIVIGAGPYGLSAGVHLKSKGLSVRVFGEPMEFWGNKMPQGMLLRSPRVASNLSDPDSAFTLDAYEAASGKQPASPLPLETFVEYGLWFRHQLESDLDTRCVERASRESGAFTLTLEDGETLRCRRLVVAAGIGPFQRKPLVFKELPSAQVSHCYEGRKIHEFSGQSVVVIGAGQSALESAALLHEAGASVEIIATIPELRWIGMHSWLHHLGPISQMLYSQHDVGPAGISRLVAAPRLVAKVPLNMRDKIRKRAVRAAGSNWLPARLEAVKKTTGQAVVRAASKGNDVDLELGDGSRRRVDHVLLGTGYDVDISRYGFLCPELVNSVEQFGGYPILKRGFSCSVPGLHFIGATAARSFGPLLYFVAGTEFASRELTRYIVRNRQSAL